MKSFVVSIVIAVLIVGGSLVYSMYLDGISKDLCEYNNEIKSSISDDDFEKAEKEISNISNFIEEKKFLLASTMEHSNIDDIEKSIAELKSYTQEKQRYDALSKCEVLNVLFEHLPKSFGLKLENVF